MKLESIFPVGLLLLLPLTAMAQDETAKDFNTFTLYVENDMLHRTDSLYTSGLKLSWISPKSKISSGFGYDLIPHMGAGFGNALIYAHAGAGLRFGWNLPNDFGTFTIRPGSDTNAAFDETDPRFFRRDQRFGIHVFAAVGGSWVLRNIFFDGNTFRNSHSVDKEPFVGNCMVGAGLVFSRFKMSFAHVYQTKEFKTQKNEHSFTAITLSFSY